MRRLGLLLPCLLVTAASALAPEPGELSQELQALCAEAPHLHYLRAGTSPGGRPIPLVVATTRPAELEAQVRVLVLCRQHGDESSPAYAAWLWLREAAGRPERFRHVAVFLLPTVNPDGAAAGTRVNAFGGDLNRDWEDRRQPETQLVEQIFERWQPHVVLDLHEFGGVVNGRRTEPDWIEAQSVGPGVPGLDETSAGLRDRLVAAQLAVGETIVGRTSGAGWSLALAHRHFAARRQAAALLIEIGDGRPDPGARLLGVLTGDLAAHADVLKPRLDRLRGLAGWTAPRALAPEVPGGPPVYPPRPQGPPLPWPWVVAAYGLVALSGVKLRADRADIDPEPRLGGG